MAIGFEFATGWEIFRLKDNASIGDIRSLVDLRNCTEPFPKAAVVHRGMGWNMTVDGTEIEYVVNELEESQAGAERLSFVMVDLKSFVVIMNMIANRMRKNFLSEADFSPGTFRASNSRFVIHIQNQFLNKDIEARPQVTGGVRLGRVLKLWRLLADNNSEAAKQLLTTGRGETYYSSVIRQVTLDWTALRDSKWQDHVPSTKLRGLATLIATYLIRGISPNQRKVGAAKYLFILMSRTKFSALFNTLPLEEQTHYRSAMEDWVDFICRNVMSRVPSMPGGLNPNGWLIEQLIDDRGNDPQGVQIPIVRRDWLIGMLNGTDLLSADAHPLDGPDDHLWRDSNPGLGHRLRGLAGLGDKMDTIQYHDRATNAAIIEFRAQQAVLPVWQWDDYADRMHRFFTAINEGERDGVIDLNAPALT